MGVVAPKNTPAPIIDTLNKAINAGLADPKIKQTITDWGENVFATSPAEFGKFLAAEKTVLLAKPMNGINAPQRPDCVAGVRGFELRNVVANYPFERSHRFAGIQPNSGQGGHSRLSCSGGDTQLGAGFCRDLQQAFCTGVGHHAASPRRHDLAAISFDQK